MAGSPSARSMTVCDHRKISPKSPVDTCWRTLSNPAQWSRSDRRSTRAAPSVRTPAATPRAGGQHHVIHRQPGHADGQRDLVPGRAAQLPQLRRSGPAFVLHRLASRCRTAWCGARCAWQSAGVVGGQRVGDMAGPLPTDPRRGDVAVGRPRAGAHVPAVRGLQFACGLQMFGDQRRVLVGRCPGCAIRWRRPGAGAIGRDRISAAIRRPPRGSAGGGRRTRRVGVNRT